MDFRQPLEDVLHLMDSTWGLFKPRQTNCGPGGGFYRPTFILSVLGSSCAHEIRPRVRLQYVQTVFRMVEFIEQMSMH